MSNEVWDFAYSVSGETVEVRNSAVRTELIQVRIFTAVDEVGESEVEWAGYLTAPQALWLGKILTSAGKRGVEANLEKDLP